MYTYGGLTVGEMVLHQYGHHLKQLSNSSLRLFLALHDLARENPSFKMTLPVLADTARIPLGDVVSSQTELIEHGLVEVRKSKVTRVGDIDCALNFTAEKDKQLTTLLQENEALRRENDELRAGDASGLADVLSPAHASVIYAAEDVLGRALTYEEVWYLGGLVAEYKSTRVRDAIYSQKNAKNPLRATYAIIRNGAKGKPFKKDEQEYEPVEYRPLGTNEEW